MATEPKRSPVELIKEQSRQLRGGIDAELATDSDHFNDDDKQLIKFHGFYQQDDRDARKDRHKEGAGKAYNFMVRCKIPGGKVTPAQYLAIDDIAGKYANGSLRITSRQGFQLHGVLKDQLKETLAGINQCLLTTLGACGDVNRNVMASPAPFATPVYAKMQELADRLAAHFAPRSGAYHEIWLDGEKVAGGEEPDIEPIYGKFYLPRKFKIGFALPDDNSVDIFAQDMGFLGIVEKGKLTGFNLYAGGGMGRTHGNTDTFPFLAQPICFITLAQFLPAAEGIIKLFRDHGNRADRKRARLKYVLHDWGIDKFRQTYATYVPFPLVAPKDVPVTGFPLFLGWQPQGDGKYCYGISIENGRIKDAGAFRLRSALRQLVQRLHPRLRLTPMQDILLCDLAAAAIGDIDKTLVEHGVVPPNRLSLVQQHSMACPAIPTCGLALSEAERALPMLIDEIEAELKRLGLARDKIGVRMTGCPNGCVRPYQSDIGIVGRSGDKYALFVGGNLVGSRLNFLLRDLVSFTQIVPTLRPLLEDYQRDRQSGEGFGDYCQRLGAEKVQLLVGQERSAKPPSD
jgi:sulfite reductase (ferredoxin)